MTDFDFAAWHQKNVGIGGSTNAAATLFFPNDSLAWALEYLKGWIDNGHLKHPSTCAIYGMSYLRARGVDHPLLDARYETHVSQAPGMLETICRAIGAWTTDLDLLSTYADGGDMLRIGGLDPAHELHIVCATGTDAATGALVSANGGQLPDSTFVQARTRLMVIDTHGKPWLVKPEAPYDANGLPNGRPITARILGSKLP